MNIDQLTERAIAKLDADPATARQFDAAAGSNSTTRKALVLATLKAAQAKAEENIALHLRRDATKRRIDALQAAVAIKSATPRPAAATSPTKDKRQGDLPMTQWCLEHLFRIAVSGDAGALAEIRRRGFAIGPHGLSKSLKA